MSTYVFLWFVACLGNACSPQSAPMTFADEQACLLAAQPVIIAWLDEHPKWSFSGSYTCKEAHSEGRGI